MATKAQIRANQTNAKRSTGPKTPEGKAVVRRNAVKHGIFYLSLDSATPLYQELLVGLFETLKPQDELQRMLVEQIAVTIIRLKRLVRHEDVYIDCVHFDAEKGAPFSAVGAYIADGTAALTMRYESSLNRLLHRLLRTYAELRDDEGWRRLRQGADRSPYLVTVEIPVRADAPAGALEHERCAPSPAAPDPGAPDHPVEQRCALDHAPTAGPIRGNSAAAAEP